MVDPIGGGLVLFAGIAVVILGLALLILIEQVVAFLRSNDPGVRRIKLPALLAAAVWYGMWLFVVRADPYQTLAVDALFFVPFYSIVSGVLLTLLIRGLLTLLRRD